MHAEPHALQQAKEPLKSAHSHVDLNPLPLVYDSLGPYKSCSPKLVTVG